MSLFIPSRLIVITGVAIVFVLSDMAIPILLSPKSRPESICTVLNWSIKSFALVTKVYKLKIDKNTTLKIAKLCRIKIHDDEIEELSLQLSNILDWVEQLNEVNTDNIEPVSSVSMAKLPFRSDNENVNDNSEDVLLNAPEKLENYFVVPKVID